MLTFRSILDALRETALSCIGSPHARSRQLAALRRLDDRLLKDIGLTVEEVKQATLRQTQRRTGSGPTGFHGNSHAVVKSID